MATSNVYCNICNVFGKNNDDFAVLLFELWHQGLQFVELRRREVEEDQDKLAAKRGQFEHLRHASGDEGREHEICSLFSRTHCGSY